MVEHICSKPPSQNAIGIAPFVRSNIAPSGWGRESEMRGDFADEAKRFEDLDDAVLEQIEKQAAALRQIKEQGPDMAPRVWPGWIKSQSTETLADLLEAVTEEIARRRALKSGGY